MSSIPQVRLGDDQLIPQIGLGVWQVPDDVATDACLSALELGYRHIDTAALYGNEEGVGRAIAACGIPRDDLFITTKVWNSDHGHDRTVGALHASLERLGLDYVDLYLIHWPTPEKDLYVDTWRAFETLLADGRTRSIGVSNFRAQDLDRLASEGLATPSVNQIELHPYLTQDTLRAYGAEHDIAIEAWSPLAQGKVLDDPVVTDIASRHDVDPGQVVLAWHLALGNIVFPKSVTPERIASNFASLDVTLGVDEVEAISALNRDDRIGPDPAAFN